jgi:hypothetical protein
MRPLRFLVPLVTVAVTLTVLVGCGGSSPSFKPIELVPQDANFIADVQVGRIINDKDIQNAYNQNPKSGDEPATWDELMAKFTAETGIDLHQFTEALIFGDLSRASDYFCGVAAGTFDETQFIENVKARSGSQFATSDYKGYTLYSQEGEMLFGNTDTQDGEALTFAFLGKTTLLFGNLQAVKDSIDVSKGDRNRLSGQLIDTYNGLGSSMIRAAAQIPESARRSLLDDSGQDEMGFSLKPFADTDAVGMSIDKSGTTETVRIEAHFVSSASARDAKDTVAGLISLLKGMAQDQATKDMLSKFEVVVTDSTLTINFSASLSDIEKAMPGLTDPFGGIE